MRFVLGSRKQRVRRGELGRGWGADGIENPQVASHVPMLLRRRAPATLTNVRHTWLPQVPRRRRRAKSVATGGQCGSIEDEEMAMAALSSSKTGDLSELERAVVRLRRQFLKDFDPVYVNNVVLPFFLFSRYEGERPSLPMIDVKLTKENALPAHLWGLLSDTWRPNSQDGVTVFLQGLEKRGPHNARKRIYMSALTPDLYRPMYADKVAQFFDALLDDRNVGKP